MPKLAAVKVKCISSVTLGALDQAFDAGETYTLPVKVVNDYPKYFEKMVAKPKNKAQTTGENK